MAEKPNRRAASAEKLRLYIARAEEGVSEAAQDGSLTERQRRLIVSAVRRKLLPPGPRGRRNSERITAAYADWKAGMRGIELYARHIPGFREMSYWKKKDKIRTLNDALSKREKRRTNPKAVRPTKPESCPPE
jgi:hypothetical protein